jgi:hypothetical protein
MVWPSAIRRLTALMRRTVLAGYTPERAAVLALAADAAAARQQALLDVLAEARLGQRMPRAREDLDDLHRGDAVLG